MNKWISSCLGLSIGFLAASSAAFADNPPQRHYFTENHLRLACTPAPTEEDLAISFRALCQNYVLGVVDGHEAWTAISNNQSRAFCLPDGTFNAQLTDAVIARLKVKPAENNGIAVFLVLEALHDAFPCQEQSK